MRLYGFILVVGMVLATNLFAAAGLECDKPTYDFGEKEQAESFVHTFVLKNTGRDAVTIKAVKKSCSCFFVEGGISGKTVKPGESVKLKVKVALSTERETLKKKMYLVFDKGYPLVLTVRGKITKTLYWHPSRLRFKDINDHKGFSSTIKLVHKGKPIRVRKVSCSWKAMEVTMDKKQEEETGFTIKFKTRRLL